MLEEVNKLLCKNSDGRSIKMIVQQNVLNRLNTKP